MHCRFIHRAAAVPTQDPRDHTWRIQYDILKLTTSCSTHKVEVGILGLGFLPEAIVLEQDAVRLQHHQLRVALLLGILSDSHAHITLGCQFARVCSTKIILHALGIYAQPVHM